MSNQAIARSGGRETLERLPDVLSRVQLAKGTVYRLIAEGRFPAPVKIGRASRWRSSEIDRWLNEISGSRSE